MGEVDRVFSAADRVAVAAAVRAAERGTAGEIVPLVVGQSDGYEVAAWKGAALGGLAALAATVLGLRLTAGWSGWLAVVFAPPAGALLGFAAGRWWGVGRRLLAGSALLDREVRQRAREAFLEHEVFRTRDRTGILLFVSLFERRVELLADSGIHAAVAPAEWMAITDELGAGLRAGCGPAALVAAIERCGHLLRERRVAPRADDANELPDELHLSEG